MNLLNRSGVVLLLSLAALQAAATDVATLRNGFTIRHESRAPMGETTRLFINADGSSFVDVPTGEIVQIERDLSPAPAPVSRSNSQTPANGTGTAPTLPTAATAPGSTSTVNVSDAVSAASDRYRIDPDLLNSVIRQESGFKVHAVSPKGAQGLMQLMPQTASTLGVSNAFDPAANVDGGTKYLRELLERYNFDLIKALAAYNAGPHRVEQYHGVPPYSETRKYVASIVRDFNRKKIAQQRATKTQSATSQTRQPSKAATASSRKGTGPARAAAAPTVKRSSAPTGN